MKFTLLPTAAVLGLALALALPVLAETKATISSTPLAEACGTSAQATDAGPSANCPAAKPGKLGSNIIPLAGSGEESEAEGEDEGGDND